MSSALWRLNLACRRDLYLTLLYHVFSLQLDERDTLVGGVYRKLMEIESRMLPCGLHVVGVAPSAEEGIATLVSIGEIDRPDNNPPVKVGAGLLCWGSEGSWLCFGGLGGAWLCDNRGM